MLNFTAKYAVVHNPHISEVTDSWLIADLTTTRLDKRQVDKRVRSEWTNVKFVGACLENAKTLKSGDIIDVTNGCMTYEVDAKSGKFYLNLTVFDFCFSETARP